MVDSSVIDTDVELHRSAYTTWFAEAGLDEELAASLYAVESDASTNPFAEDAGNLLRSLHRCGVQACIVSDIHFDLRPAFAQHQNSDGSTWTDLIDAWVVSFEAGVAKPDPAIFKHRLAAAGTTSARSSDGRRSSGGDGAAVAVGIATLLLAGLQGTTHLRLHRVLDLVCPTASRFPT